MPGRWSGGDQNLARPAFVSHLAPAMSPSIDDRFPRVVTLERWRGRAFFVVACPFRVDLPLDMSGCVLAALRDASLAGRRRPTGGAILASDARRGGAVFVEVVPHAREQDSRVVDIEADVVTRRLPIRPSGLRSEVEELLRWSEELGREVASFYVGFVASGPRAFRAAQLFATLDGGEVVEHFEVRVPRRRYVTRVA
jgi:hypothetical protein